MKPKPAGMSPFKIERYRHFNHDPVIIDQLQRVIKTSYQEFDILKGYLLKDLKDCDELYVAKDDYNEIAAFFMVGLLQLDDEVVYYLGLSACLHSYKNNGLGKALYLKFAVDCKRFESEIGKRILCYWTTASPIPYYWFCINYLDVEPDLDGKHSADRQTIVRRIIKEKYPAAKFDESLPFVLRGAVSNFRFSSQEKARLQKAMTDLNIEVFE